MSSPQIEDYQFGHIVIDGQSYDNDVIILPEGVSPDWWRNKGHELQMQDLDRISEAGIEVLVIGQGTYGRMTVPQQTREALEGAGLEVITQESEEACQTYNRLRKGGRVAAALHLTC